MHIRVRELRVEVPSGELRSITKRILLPLYVMREGTLYSETPFTSIGVLTPSVHVNAVTPLAGAAT